VRVPARGEDQHAVEGAEGEVDGVVMLSFREREEED